MKKKRNVLTSALIVLTLALTACSGGNNNPAPANGNKQTDQAGAATQSPAEVVHLKFWGGVPEEAGPKAVVDAWNAENPGVQVEYVRYVNDDGGNLKLDTALLTGEGVDLYVTYGQPVLQKRVDAGSALNLSELTDYNISEKMGPFAEDTKINGAFYAMPTVESMDFIWINKTALEEVGLEVPKSWTLETLRDYAKKLTKEGRYGYVQQDWFLSSPMDGVFQSKHDENGASRYDHPAVKQSLQIFHDMMHKDKSMLSLGEQVSTKADLTAMFLKGEAAMLGAGGWIFRSANNLTDFPRDFEIALAPLTTLEGYEDEHAFGGGLSDTISINPNSKHTKEAWAFLKWYADGGMNPMAAGGRIPSSKEIDAKSAVDTMLKGVEHLYDMESIEHTLFGEYKMFQNKVDRKVFDMRAKELEKYFLNAQSLDETINSMVKQHNELLKQ